MSETALLPEIAAELKEAADRALASGSVLAPHKASEQLALFRERFGPEVLRRLQGADLLNLMHARGGEPRCLMYWLEFKQDEEFSSRSFGSIAGGSALKFGLFQREHDGAWVSGSANQQQVLTAAEAAQLAERQRDGLLAAHEVLAAFDARDASDAAYAGLQDGLASAAPELCGLAWTHKYWYLIHSDKIDSFHSPRFQRFHLLKLLQMPPDRVGVLDSSAPRFLCAGRFVSAARALGITTMTLGAVLKQLHGTVHRYWRVGTKAGDSGESQWPQMSSGSYVSIGWADNVPDLTSIIGTGGAREQIGQWLLPVYPTNAAVRSRKAGEILKFAQHIAENDLVLASDGQRVVGIGKVTGLYEYDGSLLFPHKRAVNWLSLEPWSLPATEGLRTTVYELGKNPANILMLERHLRQPSRQISVDTQSAPASTPALTLPPLDPLAARIDGILRKKGQAILYGPPGTGKTYHAIRVAAELAARRAYQKSYSQLTESERSDMERLNLVRFCTFHPSYGYEHFLEGLRPKTVDGRMVFEPEAGIFKDLCRDAQADKARQHYFLIVDEINRGDVPRIFGELLTALEQDKRNRAVVLPVTKTLFRIPPNVFLIGTMNTADRSISLLDAALRRRFGFVELMPDSSVLRGRKVGYLPLGPWLDALNERLRRNLKRDARNLQIGHSYLLGSPPVSSVAEFARVLRDELIPLLEEYCYEDFAVLKDILGAGLVDVEEARIKAELFDPNREDDLLEAVSFEELELRALAEEAVEETEESGAGGDDENDAGAH